MLRAMHPARGKLRFTPTPKKKESKTVQMRDLNAPRRLNEDFLKYVKSDDCSDEHLLGLNDLSPFIDINFPVVSGFSIDAMHTMYAGCLRRRLIGIVSLTTEGKLNSTSLAAVNTRLKLFEKCKPSEFERHVRSLSNCIEKYKMHELRDFLMYNLFPVFSGILQGNQLENIMLLQYGMLLLGGFDPKPVPTADILEATRVFKLYVQQIIDFGYPVRPTIHAIIHLPEDANNFECGVECQSAFLYENFYRFFRRSLRSGSKPLEQYRNQLVRRSKYLLQTASDGTILETGQQFKMEVKKRELERSDRKIVLNFSIRNAKSDNPHKVMKFPEFSLSNMFPNNVCMLKNGKIVVCTDIVEYPKGSKIFSIVGFRFLTVENAFATPYPSYKFKTHVVSKLDHAVDEWNVNSIMCKMYAMPLKLSDYGSLPDITVSLSSDKWFVTPVRHTL